MGEKMSEGKEIVEKNAVENEREEMDKKSSDTEIEEGDIPEGNWEISENENDVMQETELEKMKRILAEKEKEVEEYRAFAMRMQADFENFKRRSRQEKEEISQKVKGEILLSILPVYDNLARALQTFEKGGEESIRAGIEMIYRHFSSLLEGFGVQKIDAHNKPFDPILHEAVSTEENSELPDNTVVEEYQNGYLLNGRVLRPAMVKVAKNNG